MKHRAKIGVFGMVPVALLNDARVEERHIRVYTSLSSFQGSNEKSFPSIPQIAKRAGASESTCKRALVELDGWNWVIRVRRGNRQTNVYTVLHDVEERVAVIENEDMSDGSRGDPSETDLIGHSREPPDMPPGDLSLKEHSKEQESTPTSRWVTDLFWSLFKLKTGEKPLWKAQYAGMAKKLAEAYSMPVLTDCMDHYFTDPWYKRRGWDFGIFFSEINKLVAVTSKKRPAADSSWECPSCHTVDRSNSACCLNCGEKKTPENGGIHRAAK